MNKDLKATLITISMILGFTGIVSLVIAFPQILLWLLVGITIFCGINIAILLWEIIRESLEDKDKKHKREARLKDMMENDQKLGLYDLDKKEWPKNWGEDWKELDDDFFGKMDEDDKNQIG
jgi:hypothetical protein